MTIADENQNPKPAKKLAKSLDTIAALRIAMEQRLAATGPEEKAKKETTSGADVTAPTEQEILKEPTPSTTAASLQESQPHHAFSRANPIHLLSSSRRKESSDSKEKAKASDDKIHDPAEWSRVMFRIAERSQKLIHDFLERNKNLILDYPIFDPAHISELLPNLPTVF